MALQGFDKSYFLPQALAQLQTMDVYDDIFQGQNVVFLEEQLAANNLTAEDLYSGWGWKYGLTPNQYFDPNYYMLALSKWAVENNYCATMTEAKIAVANALAGQDPYQHYQQYGSGMDINPSAAFDESSYIDNLFAWAQSNAADTLTELGISDAAGLRTFFNSNGLSALGNYMEYGRLVDISATPVSAGEVVSEGAGTTFNIEHVDLGTSDVDIMHLTGDQMVRIDFTNPANQIKGLDLDGNGAIDANGVENNVIGKAANYEIVDAYARNPLNEGDKIHNFLGDINYDGTGFAGDGVSTDGNIFLGGLGVDKAFGGIGNDFLAGGGVASGRFVMENGVLMDTLYHKPATGATADYLSGGRNADFFFAELSALDPTDGLGTTFDGGKTTDDSAAGLATDLSGVNSQNNDWILLEASDDDEPVVVNLGDEAFDLDEDGADAVGGGAIRTHSGRSATLVNIESLDASGNLYGHVNDIAVELGARATDLRSTSAVAGTENYGIGSTAQLNVKGSSAANVIIGGYDNDKINGAAGDDILFGGNLNYLLTNRNNPNLLNAEGGLELNVNGAHTVTDGRDILLGGTGNDNIVFEMDGGQIDGGADRGTNSGDALKNTGDTLWLTNFSMGRLEGAVSADEGTAQAAALQAVTTDSKVRMDLGNTDAALNYINYGGSDNVLRPSQDQTNYTNASDVQSVKMTGVESVIATGLGAIDFKSAGTNSPELHFSNQQNFFAIDADLDLRGSGRDNTLYANTGKDVIEGREGDDNLSGGKNDDVFIFQFGDGVDTVHRQLDADGNNIWDTDAYGRGLFVQDFRAPQEGDITASRLTIDFGSTDLTSENVTVGMFNLVIGGTSFTVSYNDLVAAKSATALAAVVDAAYKAIDPNVSVTALNDHVLVVTDTEGRDISDTISEGYAVGVILGNGSAETLATFSPGGDPIGIVENDILIFKDYQNRAINLGTNETIEEINNAAQLVAKFDTTGTQLSDAQQYLVKLTDVNEGDKVTITINGKNYSYTAKAHEDSTTVVERLAAVINNELDLNSASGKIVATPNADSAEFGDDLTPNDVRNTDDRDIAVISVGQGIVSGSETYMSVSVTVTNALTGSSSGHATVHNQSGTFVDLVGFDGRDGNVNSEDVLFLGRGEDTVSILQTAKNAGETLTGKDATFDLDSTPGNYDWINGDDLLYGGDGDDTINAGTGDDRIMMTKGTDIVDGGGNSLNPDATVKTYVDVLQAEEGTFGTGTHFKVTLDGTLGALGAGTVVAIDGSGADVGTTAFTQIETVRVLENNRNSMLDIKTLSDNVAAAVATDKEVKNGIEGVTVNLTRENPNVNYTIDGTLTAGKNDGEIDFNQGTNKYYKLSGDYNKFEATKVFGVENVISGNANDTINIDESQITANNRIEAGSQQSNSENLAGNAGEGEDLVVYNHASGILDSNADGKIDMAPYITVKAEASANTDEVRMTGNILGTAVITDTLVDVERIDVSDAAKFMTKDGLDVSGITNGATIAFGVEVDVQKSLGGEFDSPIDTLAEAEANTLEVGGISVTGGTLGNELLEITGITQLEKVTGSAGNDRVVIGNATGMNSMTSHDDVALGRASMIVNQMADKVVQNVGLYEFNLGEGTKDALDYLHANDDIVVSIDTTGAGKTYILVDDSAGGGVVLTDDKDDRVDLATGVEQFWAANDGFGGVNGIDLTAATVATTIEFSKESVQHDNESKDPNGDRSDDAVNIIRGAELRSTDGNTVFANFMERTANPDTGDANPNGIAHWNTIYGSATLAETVIMTDNETDAPYHNMILGGGQNVVDYTARTTPIIAFVHGVDQDHNTQSVSVDNDNITVAYAAYNVANPAASEKTLTIIASSEDHDKIDISNLDAAHGAATIDSYNLVDLQSGIIVEDVLNARTADEQSKVIYTNGFEDIQGSAGIDRLYGDGSANSIDGGAGDDWIIGRGGRGPANDGPGHADILAGGDGNDRFIYENESDSPTVMTGNLGDLGQDRITDFRLGDALVFNTTDSGVVAQGAAATLVEDNGAGHGFRIQLDQNADGVHNTESVHNVLDHDYTIIDDTGFISSENIIVRVFQSEGQQIQYLDKEIGGVDGQYEIVYTSANQSKNDEFHSFELDSADSGIGHSADKIDLRSFDFGVFSGNHVAGDGITPSSDLNDDGISDLVQDIIYTTPTTVQDPAIDSDLFFHEGRLATGAHRAVHVQLEAGSGGLTSGDSFRVFVDVNMDGNYTAGDDLVFDLRNVQNGGANFNATDFATALGDAAVKHAFYDDANANSAESGDNGIFIFNDAQYQLWNTVAGPHDNPVANDDNNIFTAVSGGAPVEILVADLIANDAVAAGYTLDIIAVDNQGTDDGTVELSADGHSIIFTPAAGYEGEAHFGYTVSDGTMTSSAVVTGTVNAIHDAPVAHDDVAAFTMDQDTVMVINVADLIANDSYDPAFPPSIALIDDNGTADGTAVLSADGLTITFTAAPGYTGPAEFTYTLNDGTYTSDPATVTGTINTVVPVITEDVTSGNIGPFDAHDGLVTYNIAAGNYHTSISNFEAGDKVQFASAMDFHMYVDQTSFTDNSVDIVWSQDNGDIVRITLTGLPAGADQAIGINIANINTYFGAGTIA